MYPLNSTKYTIKYLETLCDKTYNRTPFEPSTKYNTQIIDENLKIQKIKYNFSFYNYLFFYYI